mmetsp:Transcript_41713/g.120882  ORF Transcript_41713/g.120882 Transcript_41713/m.120882 type:complete len:341 (-) Transcript_41713:91-1113(-)
MGDSSQPRSRDVVLPLDVTLEELYCGATRRVRVNRTQLRRSRRDVLQDTFAVKIERGAPDGHRVTFPGAARAQPGGEAGDVCFVLQQQQHPRWRRDGSNLFIEHRLSLLEALTGYTITLRHLDGQKLLVRSKPGEIVHPRSVLPTAEAEWERYDHMDAFPGQDAASLRTGDLDACKELCRRRGYGGFTYWEDTAYFRARDRTELLAARSRSKGSVLFVCPDPMKSASVRMQRAIRGAGMPCLGNPDVRGNLFLLFRVELPTQLDEQAVALLQQALPHDPAAPAAPQGDFEELPLIDLDPTESRREHHIATGGGRAFKHCAEPEDEAPPAGSPGPPPCRQM